MRRELIEDCIASLPNPDIRGTRLSVREPRYVKEINGENGTRRIGPNPTAAILEISYLTFGKGNARSSPPASVQNQKPIIKEVTKSAAAHSKDVFMSIPTEGGTFAGQSNPQYYFTKADDAVKDVRRSRPHFGIQQQKPVPVQGEMISLRMRPLSAAYSVSDTCLNI